MPIVRVDEMIQELNRLIEVLKDFKPDDAVLCGITVDGKPYMVLDLPEETIGKMIYPIVICQNILTQDFGVIVPDIDGCYSAGKTFSEALMNAKEAIECHLEGLLLGNEKIPEPSPIEKWTNHKDFVGNFFALVEVDLKKGMRWTKTREEGGN